MTGNAVTVLVATRNRPNELKRCLQSILVSSYPSFRLMVVDQSDNDDALRACAAITDGRLEYVRDRGTGLSRARNVGIGAITSGIIAMTDDDCVVATDWLERLVALFRDNAECMLAFGNFVAAPHDWRREFIPSAVFDRPATHSGRHYRFLDHGCGGNMRPAESFSRSWAGLMNDSVRAPSFTLAKTSADPAPEISTLVFSDNRS